MRTIDTAPTSSRTLSLVRLHFVRRLRSDFALLPRLSEARGRENRVSKVQRQRLLTIESQASCALARERAARVSKRVYETVNCTLYTAKRKLCQNGSKGYQSHSTVVKRCHCGWTSAALIFSYVRVPAVSVALAMPIEPSLTFRGVRCKSRKRWRNRWSASAGLSSETGQMPSLRTL